MLEIIKVNFNIKSNRLVRMKIKSGTILQNLKIPKKLFKIFTFNTLTNLVLVNQQYLKAGQKKIENPEFSSIIYSRDFTS